MNIETKFRGAGPIDRDLGPIVPLPRNGLSGIGVAVIAAILAVLLFLYLNGRRDEAKRTSQQPQALDGAVFAPPPPLVLPPNQSPLQVINVTPAPSPLNGPAINASGRNGAVVISAPAVPNGNPIIAPPTPMPMPNIYSGLPPATPQYPSEAPPVPASSGLTEPALVGDSVGEFDQGDGAEGPGDAPSQASAQAASSRSKAGAVRPTVLANRASVMPTGTMIPAVLETPIDTSRPGFVRAIVSQDARGFNGRRVLVPRGSRLIGEFQSDPRAGSKRVLVTWTELVRPDGVVMKLDSPAADPLGGPGVPGTVHGFFLARFFSSAFQSALYVGQTLLGRAGTTVVIGAPTGAATGAAAQVLAPSIERPPRITVRQGTLVNVFVARDLDFSSGSSRRRQ